MKTLIAILLLVQASSLSYAQVTTRRERQRTYVSTRAVGKQPQKPPTPDQLWGKLFEDVQLERALKDNKTFVDAVPKFAPAVIQKRFAALPGSVDSATLADFVFQNFKVPVTPEVKASEEKVTLKQHLEGLWDVLTRKADVIEKYSSLLPLPEAYIVPGGRFREIYYWDSYFTMQGLATSGRYDLIESMLDNFKYLIDTYGHIPNGNRSYYLSRSQPPYFALMVQLLQEKMGDRVYKKYLGAMQKEYNWWMEGSSKLKEGEAHRRVVRLADGTLLNRYFDDKKAPREESYYEDVQLGRNYQHDDGMAYTNLRAGAESGWDFSSRWFADTMHLNTIETTNVLQVDLNCLLYACEGILSKACKSQQLGRQASDYAKKADRRQQAILRYFWNEDKQFFFDYHLPSRHTTDRWSLAGVMPLFVKIATPAQAEAAQQQVADRFLRDGGVVTTPYHTHQQWDAPNGWAPLQFLTVMALKHYRYDSLALTIASRWMQVNETVFERTGKMLEKYNVEDIHLASGGGEYPTQDGFGWSNGVYLKFYQMYKGGR